MDQLFSISVFTEHKLGLLGRLAALLSRRRLQVESLNLADTEYQGIARCTIGLYATRQTAERVVAQIGKIIEVLVVSLVEEEHTTCAQLALYKVPLRQPGDLDKIVSLARTHTAQIGSVSGDCIILEKSGPPEAILRLRDELEAFGLREFVHSGKISVPTFSQSFTESLPEGFSVQKR